MDSPNFFLIQESKKNLSFEVFYCKNSFKVKNNSLYQDTENCKHILKTMTLLLSNTRYVQHKLNRLFQEYMEQALSSHANLDSIITSLIAELGKLHPLLAWNAKNIIIDEIIDYRIKNLRFRISEFWKECCSNQIETIADNTKYYIFRKQLMHFLTTEKIQIILLLCPIAKYETEESKDDAPSLSIADHVNLYIDKLTQKWNSSHICDVISNETSNTLNSINNATPVKDISIPVYIETVYQETKNFNFTKLDEKYWIYLTNSFRDSPSLTLLKELTKILHDIYTILFDKSSPFCQKLTKNETLQLLFCKCPEFFQALEKVSLISETSLIKDNIILTETEKIESYSGRKWSCCEKEFLNTFANESIDFLSKKLHRSHKEIEKELPSWSKPSEHSGNNYDMIIDCEHSHIEELYTKCCASTSNSEENIQQLRTALELEFTYMSYYHDYTNKSTFNCLSVLCEEIYWLYSNGIAIVKCEDCEKFFSPKDKRRRYHPKCSSSNYHAQKAYMTKEYKINPFYIKMKNAISQKYKRHSISKQTYQKWKDSAKRLKISLSRNEITQDDFIQKLITLTKELEIPYHPRTK